MESPGLSGALSGQGRRWEEWPADLHSGETLLGLCCLLRHDFTRGWAGVSRTPGQVSCGIILCVPGRGAGGDGVGVFFWGRFQELSLQGV